MSEKTVNGKPVTAASKYLAVAPGVELHYLEAGKGQPMILIPGLTFGGDIFEHQIDYFSRTYRVIAVDPEVRDFRQKRWTEMII